MKMTPLGLLLASLCIAGTTRADPDALFNGRNFTGWRHDDSHWRVEEGAIVGEIPAGETLRRNLFLFWEGELHDFDLRLEFRVSGHPSANSGVQFRSQMLPGGGAAGYQADIDGGAVWLGRIYDEHGRGLLAERGSRVRIEPDGRRTSHAFRDAASYREVIREGEWNSYRIRAVGPRIETHVNGELASDLTDEQTGQLDFSGRLALQLHSGPGPARIEFRKILLTRLGTTEPPGPSAVAPAASRERAGIVPRDAKGRPLNLGFEKGTLDGWKVSGTAWERQPVRGDTVTPRRPGQASRHVGEYWVGGYEHFGDSRKGVLESEPFEVTHRWASFLVGGGPHHETRVEVVDVESGKVIHAASGQQLEDMAPAVVDLEMQLGRRIAVRVVDEHAGGWGHINYDDFRFHETLSGELLRATLPRPLRDNPLLSHLVRNPAARDAAGTVAKMYLPEGFEAHRIAAEPDLVQPIAFAIDERGRLWVAEALSYPQKSPAGEGRDRISILADADGDGRFETRKVFAEGLNLVSGIEVGHGGVWIGAAPELLFLPDANRDDVPDGPPEILLDGWGYQDTHETLNSFRWGPDGWLYGVQGVFNTSRVGVPGTAERDRVTLNACVWRYHPVTRAFEVFARGGSNQWGLDYNEHGELFMTHCRSFWGGGPTTHVVLRGHYWNQANARHAPFVSGEHPPGSPHHRNFLRASARYGHGEGGAGKRGSRALYGGHSHVGTMIYQGDNWPAEYRGDLYTHNLHGHRVNRQRNRPSGAGYETVHAGQDLLFVDDPRYVAVDLDYGPDGSVYIIDWYDRQHCHSPHMERWDRSNGRVYRISYAPTFTPRTVDLGQSSSLELARLQTHENAWYARTARRLLHERRDAIAGATTAALQELLDDARAAVVLRALWSLHVVDKLDAATLGRLLDHDSARVRAWAVRLATESELPGGIADRLRGLARSDPSPVVRLAIASALPILPVPLSWSLADELVRHAGDASDAYLPRMIWFGVASNVHEHLAPALRLAETSRIDEIADFTWWFASTRPAGLERVVSKLQNASDARRQRILRAATFARRGVPLERPPAAWLAVADVLYESPVSSIRAAAQRLGALFSHEPVLARLRETLASEDAAPPARREAFGALTRIADAASLPAVLRLLEDSSYRKEVIAVLARYEDGRVPGALIDRFASFSASEQRRVVNTLTTRPSFARPLLEAMADGRIEKGLLSSFHVRQLKSLRDAGVDALVSEVWGEARETAEDAGQRLAQLATTFREAPLWAYDVRAGKAVFDRVCASCHASTGAAGNLGPNLAGSGRNGVEYFLESVLDPSAVVGEDFRLTVLVTKTGSVISGVVQEEDDETVTIRTPEDRRVVGKADILARRQESASVMPEGLLDGLSQREVIELLKYLGSM